MIIFQMSNPFYFYGHSPKCGDKRCFSNWYPSEFVDSNAITFSNSEQYMMYHKAKLFGDNSKAEEILQTSDPSKAKKMGREVRNFDPDIWNKNARDIVYSGCLLKFSQNEEIKNFLLSTGDSVLVEASPYDQIWGIGISVKQATKGVQWRGTNWLGECLMRVRNTLRNI
jgi:ribA/ribD-fused uncharacterized protein